MIIAVDFDGTTVTHTYPEMGEPVPGAVEWLQRFQDAGAKLILWTMRSHKNGSLQPAVDYWVMHGHLIAPVFASTATTLSVYKLSPGRYSGSQLGAGLPTPQ